MTTLQSAVVAAAQAPSLIQLQAPALLPFAPLTNDELTERRREALMTCGYRCEVVIEFRDGFLPVDLARLAECGREAHRYGKALDAREPQA